MQLDNLTLAGFPPLKDDNKREKLRGRASGFHRDRFSRTSSSGHYERPLSFNAICYLQDLTDETGPLRVVRSSHLQTDAVDLKSLTRPQPNEELFYMKAGDVIVTCAGLLHSGSPNLSPDRKRYFFSVHYNITWLKHTDTYDGPNCRDLKAWARRRKDHRSLRLLGDDRHLQQRANSGFQEPDEVRWERWAQEDRDAMAAAEAAKAAKAARSSRL